MNREIENPMVNERIHRHSLLTTFVEDEPECDCGDYANLKVHGKYRCWECAENEGIERL